MAGCLPAGLALLLLAACGDAPAPSDSPSSVPTVVNPAPSPELRVTCIADTHLCQVLYCTPDGQCVVVTPPPSPGGASN